MNLYATASAEEWFTTPVATTESMTAATIRAAATQTVVNLSETLTRTLLQRSRIVEVPVVESAPAAAILQDAADKLNDLLKLSANWDSYGARVPDPDVAINVLGLVERIVPERELVPNIVPTVQGGFQLEWQTPRKYLQVSVRPDVTVSAYFEDDSGGEPLEEELAINSPLLAQLVERMRVTAYAE